MKLIVVNSNSKGNAYALDSGKEILLLEAGCKMEDVKRAIGHRLQDVIGCIITHEHGDHARYAEQYAQNGVNVYGPDSLREKKKFPYGKFTAIPEEKSITIGSFTFVAFENYHDVKIYGYLVRHDDMGTLLFSTDTYKMGIYITGVSHFLIEANYSDELLKKNVWNGNINPKQADRIMLSHMSLEYAIKYLRECEAENAKTIILCHLSERNSNPDDFMRCVTGAFGVPTYVAQKGTIVELNKELI